MAFGLGLGDLPLIGADIFNARAEAESEIEAKRREAEALRQERRKQALEQAILETRGEQSKVDLERSRTELGRINRGDTPVPVAGPSGRAAPHIGLGVQGTDEESFDTYLDRFGRETEARVDRVGREAAARAEATARFRAERPDAPPTHNEAQDVAQTIVRQQLAANPLAELDEVLAQFGNPEFRAQQDPSVRLMLDGGRVGETLIREAYQRIRGNQQFDQAYTQQVLADIDAECAAGSTHDQIYDLMSTNPRLVDSITGTLMPFYADYIDTHCSNQ